MATKVGEAWYEVNAKIDKLDRSLDQADDRIDETGRHAEQTLGGRLTNALGGVGSTIATIGKTAVIAGGVAVAALGGIGALAIPAAAEWETFNAQFTALLGTAEAAQTRMEELAEFGARTPFELTEIVAADKILTAFGQHSQRNLEAVGNAAAASGRTYEEVAMTFSRVTAGQFGEAFQNLAAMGIATREDLEMKGLTFDASGSFTGSADQATDAVLQIIEEKFGGSGAAPSVMEAMSNTVSGQWSNLKDNMAGLLREIGALLLPMVRGFIDGANQAIPVVKEFLIGVFSRAKPILETIGEVLGDVFAILGDIFSGEELNVGAEQFGGFGLIVQSVVESVLMYIELMRGVWEQVWRVVGRVIETVAPIIVELIDFIAKEVLPPFLAMFQQIGDWIEANWPVIGSIIERVGRILMAVFEAVVPVIIEVAQVVLPILMAAFEAILPIVDTVLSVIEGLITWLTETFIPAIQPIVDSFVGPFVAMAEFMGELWNGLLKLIGDVVSGIIGIIQGVVEIAAQIPGPWQEGAAEMAESLGDMKESVDSWGEDTESSLTTSMADQRRIAEDGARRTANAYADQWPTRAEYLNSQVTAYLRTGTRAVQAYSPPRYGPLVNIEEWGASTAMAYGEGFASKARDIAALVEQTLQPARAAFGFEPSMNFAGVKMVEARLVVELRDPTGSLATVPGGAPAIARTLQYGIEATGLLRNLQHELAIR